MRPRAGRHSGTDPQNVEDPFVLELEGGMEESDIDALRDKGHELVTHPGRVFGGSAKLIEIDPATHVRTAGSDPRTDGHAAAV